MYYPARKKRVNSKRKKIGHCPVERLLLIRFVLQYLEVNQELEG